MTEKRKREAQYEETVSAMEGGDERAKTKVAFCKVSGLWGVEVDLDSGVALLEERVKDRDTEAMWMLGYFLEHGMGTEQDIERANTLYQKSYEEGLLLENNTDRDGLLRASEMISRALLF